MTAADVAPPAVPGLTSGPVSGAVAVTTVRVVADDPFLRSGLAGVLATGVGLAVTDIAGADVTVLAVDDGDDPRIVADIRATRATRSRVLLLAGRAGTGAALRAIEAGASALLHRSASGPDALCHAVRTAATGHVTLPPGMFDELVETLGRRPAPEPTLDERERAVLGMVADGYETAEIAATLAYSTRTVTGVVHDITHRLGLRNRAHAVAFALRAGLI